VTTDDRVFWRSDTCCVWVGFDDDAALVFGGQELAHLGEAGRSYEYWVTVAPAQFDRLRRALRPGDTETGLLDLVCAHVDDVMADGERSFLDRQGIEYTFRSY
jgi:hypothetical protein